jgi:hypothetical protein
MSEFKSLSNFSVRFGAMCSHSRERMIRARERRNASPIRRIGIRDAEDRRDAAPRRKPLLR